MTCDTPVLGPTWSGLEVHAWDKRSASVAPRSFPLSSFPFHFYPAIRSIRLDTISLLYVTFCMYGYRFLSRGFTDRREILHDGLATFQIGFLLSWGIAPGMTEPWA